MTEPPKSLDELVRPHVDSLDYFIKRLGGKSYCGLQPPFVSVVGILLVLKHHHIGPIAWLSAIPRLLDGETEGL